VKRTGGTIDLPQTLAELRGEFDFRDHPDYRRDADLLERLSRDLLADVRTQIAGVPPLPRTLRSTAKTPVLYVTRRYRTATID
jgi:hypothetical protein